MFDRINALLSLVCAGCVSTAIGVNVIANPGESDVHLLCYIPNHKWMKDNNTIEATNTGYTLVPENQTLIIKTIDHQHMGVYVCTDDNERTETIIVFVPSYVKHFEKTKNMIQDDPLQLECRGYGYPIPVVEWYKGSELRATDGDRITLKDTPKQSDSSVMTNGTIRIQKMAFEDAGDYVCVATNSHGVGNATITVQVKDKLAALWPFLGICAEVAILCAVIFIYERRRTKKMQQEEERAAAEETEQLNANNETKGNDDVRQRK